MRADDEPVIDLDLDLVVEGDGRDDESTEDIPRSRRAELAARLRRPWPRPLIVVVTAVVSIGGMAAIQRPEPEATVPPVAERTVVPEVIVPGDGFGEEFLIGGDGDWVAVEPAGELLVEASEKLGAPEGEPVYFDSRLGGGTASVSAPIPAGEYRLEVACASSVDDVSMRLDLEAGDWDASHDIPCDGPDRSIGIALTEPTVVTIASVGPNAPYIGYSFRIIPAEG